MVGKITFTVWACGCNLKCPFCHNWRIAEGQGCAKYTPKELAQVVFKHSDPLDDLIHLTGGEPMIWAREVKEFAREIYGFKPLSINSNCTVNGERLIEMIKEGLVMHVATDIKEPYEVMYGYEEETAKVIHERFLRCLSELAKVGVEVELRIPVAKGLTVKYLDRIEEALSMFKPSKARVVVNPLLGKPVTSPRVENWHYFPKGEEVERIARLAERLGFRVKVNSILSVA